MKKITRTVLYVLLSLAAIATLTGCTNFSKQKALAEYSESLHDDVVYWEAIQLTTNQMMQSDDYRTYVSYIGMIIEYLDIIVTNAENRNVGIYDYEIKSFDDYYVKALKYLRSGYALMREGFNEQDESKMDLGERQMESALENLKIYSTGMKDYMERYNIKSNVDMDELLEALSEQ
ncbi:MAG: hypothetical protein J6X97_08155 [Lachnospiraceae bacterium]|nr:hypothetical protein [Lachnospiraceae bacterium]